VPVAPRTVPAGDVWILQSILRDVIQRGTGRKALALGRSDLAGKTGTTNSQRDAWFCGFAPSLVAVAWVGFDEHTPLGHNEVGGRAALPMWIKFMRTALAGVPDRIPPPPKGIVRVRINPETGRPAHASDPQAVFETFRAEQLAAIESAGGFREPGRARSSGGGRASGTTERLF